MILYPAIDLFEGQAVRLFKGDYEQMTIYSDEPVLVAKDFVAAGCDHIHLVDLEGARSGTTPNLATILQIKEATGAFCEVGGGIRSMETIDTYLKAGLDRVILGTAAVKDPALLRQALSVYGEKIAVGVDVRDGLVAVSGWRETSALTIDDFCRDLESLGVATIICTDISRDGAMRGPSCELYRRLQDEYAMQIIASGGVSSLKDLETLATYDIHGAIVGKAYYTGAIDLAKANDLLKNH